MIQLVQLEELQEKETLFRKIQKYGHTKIKLKIRRCKYLPRHILPIFATLLLRSSFEL